MKKATREVREILEKVSELQGLIGKANANFRDDRGVGAFERCGEALQEAFDLCVEIRSEYPPT